LRSSSFDSLTSTTLLSPVDTLDCHSNQSLLGIGTPRGSNGDVALKNFRNYQNRVSSPPTIDRTPSPNILDLLGSTHSGPVGQVGKQCRELSESDGEKDVADISDKKVREDLEVGNVSVELLRRICDEVVTGQVVLSTTPPTAHRLPDVEELRIVVDENILIPTDDQNESFNELFNRNLQVSDHGPENLQWIYEFWAENDSPSNDSLPSDSRGKGSTTTFKDEALKKTNGQVAAHDKYSEDSNKLGVSDPEKTKNSGMGVMGISMENTASPHVDGPISRKLILDKIESEKRCGRRRRSGSGASRMTSGLTSEEFDELYRLPTEHLRKDRGQGERNSRSTAPSDRSHNHHRHRPHSHDSYASGGGRHALTDDDWAYRGDVEGACGGADYYCYDDMMMSSHGIDFDVADSHPPYPTRRPLDLSATFGNTQYVDDLVESLPSDAVGFPRRRCGVVARDNSSSPESPISGARPKKSPKKHRAL